MPKTCIYSSIWLLFMQTRGTTMEYLEKRRVVLGESHPNTLQSLKMLAKSYLRHGKYDQFEPLFLEFIEKKGFSRSGKSSQ
jgi:hypothetical protein